MATANVNKNSKKEENDFSLFHIGEDLSFTEEDFFLPTIPQTSGLNNNGSQSNVAIGNQHRGQEVANKAKTFQFVKRNPLQCSPLHNKTSQQQHLSTTKPGLRQEEVQLRNLGKFPNNTHTSNGSDCEPPTKVGKFNQPLDAISRQTLAGNQKMPSSQADRNQTSQNFRFKAITTKSTGIDPGMSQTMQCQTTHRSSQFNSNAVQTTGQQNFGVVRKEPLNQYQRTHSGKASIQPPRSNINTTSVLVNSTVNKQSMVGQNPTNVVTQQFSQSRNLASCNKTSVTPKTSAIDGDPIHESSGINRRNSVPNTAQTQMSRSSQFSNARPSSPTPGPSGVRSSNFQRSHNANGQFIRTSSHLSSGSNISPHQVNSANTTRPSMVGQQIRGFSPASMPQENLSRSHTPRAVTPQTPLLTSRVAQLCQTPVTSGGKISKCKSRKFPGPAGMLPTLTPGQKMTEVEVSVPPSEDKNVKKAHDNVVVASSQETEDDFGRGAWMNMKTDMGLDEHDPHSILYQSNIAIVMRKASLKQLPKGKVPHLCVMIKSVNFADASAIFKDPSGEMQGTVHRRLIEEYQCDFKPGAALVLRQVSVLSPSLRNHYLNITPSNLVHVYSAVDSNTSLSSSQSNSDRINGASGSPSCDNDDYVERSAKKFKSLISPENVTRQSQREHEPSGESPIQSRSMYKSEQTQMALRNSQQTKVIQSVKQPAKDSITQSTKSSVHNDRLVNQSANSCITPGVPLNQPKQLNSNNNNKSLVDHVLNTELEESEPKIQPSTSTNPTTVFESENLDALLEGIEDELFADF